MANRAVGASYYKELQLLVDLTGLTTMLTNSIHCDDVATAAEGLGFDSWTGQIGHSVAISMSPLRRFFGAVLPGC